MNNEQIQQTLRVIEALLEREAARVRVELAKIEAASLPWMQNPAQLRYNLDELADTLRSAAEALDEICTRSDKAQDTPLGDMGSRVMSLGLAIHEEAMRRTRALANEPSEFDHEKLANELEDVAERFSVWDEEDDAQ